MSAQRERATGTVALQSPRRPSPHLTLSHGKSAIRIPYALGGVRHFNASTSCDPQATSNLPANNSCHKRAPRRWAECSIHVAGYLVVFCHQLRPVSNTGRSAIAPFAHLRGGNLPRAPAQALAPTTATTLRRRWPRQNCRGCESGRLRQRSHTTARCLPADDPEYTQPPFRLWPADADLWFLRMPR